MSRTKKIYNPEKITKVRNKLVKIPNEDLRVINEENECQSVNEVK